MKASLPSIEEQAYEVGSLTSYNEFQVLVKKSSAAVDCSITNSKCSLRLL
jgi:hypothetical protein